MPKSYVQDKETFFVPLDCPVCFYMIRDMQDSIQYLECGCCVDCWISFLEPLRKMRGNEEYLPTEKEILAYRKKISSKEIIKDSGVI